MAAPPLPRRPEHPHQQPQLLDPIPDEPPPAYEANPSVNQEQTLEYGPTRPFHPPPGPPPLHASSYAPPPHPPGVHSHSTGASYHAPLSPPPPTLPPPSFPFWNGSNLTPAQTGFSEGAVTRRNSMYAGLPPPRPPAQSPMSNRPVSTPTPPLASTPGYGPTESPVPGKPLLHNGMLLVYPVGKDVCYKCSNTGYKPFDPYTGYRGDDPSHPCRKCWQKYGKPYAAALRISCENSPSAPPNYQRPLRLLETPQTRPAAPPVSMFTGRRPHVIPNPNAIVVRPGDPRIGGVLCRTCGGDGLVMGPFIFDEVTCERCRGTGRVF
ncbi:hypothetical protein JCM1840_005137 [Sporobolomyces johnsonii]